MQSSTSRPDLSVFGINLIDIMAIKHLIDSYMVKKIICKKIDYVSTEFSELFIP